MLTFIELSYELRTLDIRITFSPHTKHERYILILFCEKVGLEKSSNLSKIIQLTWCNGDLIPGMPAQPSYHTVSHKHVFLFRHEQNIPFLSYVYGFLITAY